MLWFAALLLVPSAPQQQCAAMDVNLPAPLAGWTRPGETVKLGQSATLPTSIPTAISSKIEDTPFVEGHTDGYVMVGVTIAVAGTYGVAIDLPGWIGMYRGDGNEGPLTSTRHSHGPECSTIRKIVYFDLSPGRHLLFLSKLNKANVKVMLVAPE